MRRVELELEHRYKNRFVGKHRLKPDGTMTVLGSARDASIRLLGEEVAGVHATIECQGNVWVLADMGSQQGTWVRKKPIVETAIRGITSVRIGGHQLRVIPREIDAELFKPSRQAETADKGSDRFHQVVIRRHGVVVKSHLLDPGAPFHYQHGNQSHLLKPPTNSKWVNQNFGDEVLVQQRLVSSDTLKETNSEKLASLVDPSLKKPAAGAVILLAVLTLLLMFAPEKPEEELVALKPEKNAYTRMIFDAKKVRQEKKKAVKLAKNIRGTSKSAPQRKNATGTPNASKASKQAGARVVNRIKSAGLGQLIGKISKRASNTAVFVQAAGKNPDTRETGRALGVAGSSTLDSNAKAVASSGGHKIGNVATAGKGGGSSAYKGVGGLSLGNVGNASVGVLEEETEVQGGLDREVIAQVIKGQLGQIRYCYERQLSANPELYGKVQVRFTIGGGGSVVSQVIGTTSLQNAMVEGCILRRIAGWQFPKPKGGTNVIVTYPFLFKSTR